MRIKGFLLLIFKSRSSDQSDFVPNYAENALKIIFKILFVNFRNI